MQCCTACRCDPALHARLGGGEVFGRLQEADADLRTPDEGAKSSEKTPPTQLGKHSCEAERFTQPSSGAPISGPRCRTRTTLSSTTSGAAGSTAIATSVTLLSGGTRRCGPPRAVRPTESGDERVTFHGASQPVSVEACRFARSCTARVPPRVAGPSRGASRLERPCLLRVKKSKQKN